MTKATLAPGEQLHFYASMPVATGSEFSSQSIYIERGQTITLTSAMIEASRDRNGDSWFDLADDREGQTERWGQVMFGTGPWPEGESALVRGSADWVDAREEARKAAWRLESDEKRSAALEAVKRDFGPVTTSQTLAQYAGDEARAATQARYARGGLDG